MKKFTKIAVAAILAVMMVFTLTSCGSKLTVADVQEDGKIIMATNAEFEPFEYIEGGEVVGIDVDISEKIAEKLGVELEVSNMEFDSIITAVKSGKAAFGAAGMTADETRRKSVDFSDTYFSASQVIIVRADETEITNGDDLVGKTIGVQLGTTGDKYCSEEVADTNVVRYDKGADAIQALLTEKVDAVVIDDFPATKYVEKNEGEIVKLDETLTEEEYAICVNKGNTEILDAINEVIRELKESGELDEIISNYITAE